MLFSLLSGHCVTRSGENLKYSIVRGALYERDRSAQAHMHEMIQWAMPCSYKTLNLDTFYRNLDWNIHPLKTRDRIQVHSSQVRPEINRFFSAITSAYIKTLNMQPKTLSDIV